MKKKKKIVRLRFRTWDIVSRAVEEGVQWGLQRAYKHLERPSQETLARHMEDEVLNALGAVIDFGEEDV